ncbi:MAG: UDP-N-acetylmuramate dehydrogenase [Planctomycetota bacterium]
MLSKKTYVGIGGAVPLLLEPRNREELMEAIETLRKENLAFRILGGGSNLLVDDRGLSEVIISTRSLSRLYKIEDDELSFGVEAGVSTARFVTTCQKFGLSGAECLIGIPGTMGGAAVMNAGGRHGSISSLIRGAKILTSEGTLEHRDLSPQVFGYRSSTLKDEVVVELTVSLVKGDKKAIWNSMSTILQEKKKTQPLMKKSCGCIFKNPECGSAGKLLDSAGMKGRVSGGAVVSDLHANFIINKGHCSFKDYYSLIQLGREEVKRIHGVDLEQEVETWYHGG